MLEKHIAIPRNTLGLTPRPGLFGITMSIRLNDFLRARKKGPKAVAPTVTEICASETLAFCFNWGRLIGAHWYHLYFDQGEAFYGHVYDRMHNKKARKEMALMKKVSVLGQADMRLVPALQAADLFAWSFNHFEKATREWHQKLNALPWHSLDLDYDMLLNPKAGVPDQIKAWNLQPRKPHR